MLNLDVLDSSALAEVITDYFGDRGSSDEEGFPEDGNCSKQITHLHMRHVYATVNNTTPLSIASMHTKMIINNNTQHNLAIDHEEPTDMDYSTTDDGSAQFVEPAIRPIFTNVDAAVMQQVATWEVDLGKKAPLL